MRCSRMSSSTGSPGGPHLLGRAAGLWRREETKVRRESTLANQRARASTCNSERKVLDLLRLERREWQESSLLQLPTDEKASCKTATIPAQLDYLGETCSLLKRPTRPRL